MSIIHGEGLKFTDIVLNNAPASLAQEMTDWISEIGKKIEDIMHWGAVTMPMMKWSATYPMGSIQVSIALTFTDSDTEYRRTFYYSALREGK